MDPDGAQVRHGAHPFCGSCTDETLPWPAPDTITVFGVGNRFYGAGAPCPRCGSVVKWYFFCLFWIPVWPEGRYRIITLRRFPTVRYVGRRFPAGAGNPYGLDRKTAALMAQAEALADEDQRTRPEPPTSRLAEHPRLRGRRFQEAEDYWELGFPEHALAEYEKVLAAHEAVLPPDDTATLQVRQRVAEAYLAVDRPVAAFALLVQTTAHLRRVLGPRHPDTLRAAGDLSNARSRLGLSRDVIKAVAAELTYLRGALGPDHPQVLRTACALGVAQRDGLRPARAVDLLIETLDRCEQALGGGHPDTGHVRDELIEACDVAEHRGRRADRRAAARGRERLRRLPDGPISSAG